MCGASGARAGLAGGGACSGPQEALYRPRSHWKHASEQHAELALWDVPLGELLAKPVRAIMHFDGVRHLIIGIEVLEVMSL